MSKDFAAGAFLVGTDGPMRAVQDGDPSRRLLRHHGASPHLEACILLLTMACTFVLPRLARAQVPPKCPQSTTPTRYSPWQSTRNTPFVSTTTDVGIIYARPRLMLGYGSPHWKFVALDAHWIVTNSFTAPYVGWRASLPFLDAMFGARTVVPWDRRILEPRESHGSDLSIHGGDERSTYDAVDFELAVYVPLLHGIAHLQGHPVIVDAPRDAHLFEEVLRAVMRPPYALGMRAGYFYGVGETQDFKTGWVAEYVVLPGRPDNVIRMGPMAYLQLDKHWEALAAFSAVVKSPDSLGIWHGTYAFLGMTHRWARRF